VPSPSSQGIFQHCGHIDFFSPGSYGQHLGILLGLTGLQEAFPTLSQGIALGLIDVIKGCTIGFTALLLTVVFYEREQLAQLTREDMYRTIEEQIMPMFR
jgi:hypothetical protein